MFFFFSSRRRHTRWTGDWSSDVCSSDLEALQAVPGFAPEGIHLLFHSSSSGERAERVSAAVPPPEAPGRNPHEGEPEQEAGTRLREKKNQGPESLERIAKAVDTRVAELDQDRWRRRVELGFVFFGKFQVDGGEVDAMLERFLFGFHLLDFAPDAGDFLFDIKNIFYLAGARSKDVLEAKLRLAVILDASNEVCVLLRDFFAILRFAFDTAEGL